MEQPGGFNQEPRSDPAKEALLDEAHKIVNESGNRTEGGKEEPKESDYALFRRKFNKFNKDFKEDPQGSAEKLARILEEERSDEDPWEERRAAEIKGVEAEHEALSVLSPDDLPEGCGFTNPELGKKALEGQMEGVLNNLDWLSEIKLHEDIERNSELKDQLRRMVERDSSQAVIDALNEGELRTVSMERAIMAQAIERVVAKYPNLTIFGGGSLEVQNFFLGDLESAFRESDDPQKNKRGPAISIIKATDLVDGVKRGEVKVAPGGRDEAIELLISPFAEVKKMATFRKAPEYKPRVIDAFKAKAVTM